MKQTDTEGNAYRLQEMTELRDSTKMKLSSTRFLHLEADRLPATTGTLELASLGDGARLDTIVSVWVVDGGAVTEELKRLTDVLATTQEDSVGTLRGTKSKLIKSQAFTTSLDDTSTGSFSET